MIPDITYFKTQEFCKLDLSLNQLNSFVFTHYKGMRF